MIAFTNGCFDLFHAGHRRVLDECSRLCPSVFVAVNDDCWVTRHKGPNRPVQDIDTRCQQVEDYLDAIGCKVRNVKVFESESQLSELVRSMARIAPPLVLVKGEEYRDKPLTGEQYASRIVYVRMLPGISTTAIIEGAKKWTPTSSD